jgi:uncharacterized membrane protein
MVNWLKFVGVFLIVIGVVTIIFSPLFVTSISYPEVNDSGFYAEVALGIVLIAVGAYLYNLGSRKEKKGV